MQLNLVRTPAKLLLSVGTAIGALVSMTSRVVAGEIMRGESSYVASGGSVQGTTVPDAGAILLLMSIGLGCLAAMKRKSNS